MYHNYACVVACMYKIHPLNTLKIFYLSYHNADKPHPDLSSHDHCNYSPVNKRLWSNQIRLKAIFVAFTSLIP